jgi:hypothetical protein
VLGAGFATSESWALALGGGAATANDMARGGGCSFEDPQCAAGDARSEATAESVGGGPADAFANAQGGRFGVGGSEVDARASALSQGHADAEAWALAGEITRGNAAASAFADGLTGAATALASSSGDLALSDLTTHSIVDWAAAGATRSGAGSKFAVARVAYEFGVPSSSPALQQHDAFAWVTVEPDDVWSRVLLSRHDNAASQITLGGDTTVIALGSLGGGAPLDGIAEAITSTSVVDLDIDVSEVPVLDDLRIAFVDPELGLIGGFQSLRLVIEEEGLLVVNRTFTTLDAALAFFDDNVISLASPGPNFSDPFGILDLRIQLDVTTSGAGQGFATDFLLAFVPEPSLAWLLALAAALGLVRR